MSHNLTFLHRASRVALVTTLIAVLSACSNDFEHVPDAKLADGIYDCRTDGDQSPGMAIRCDNYQRECNRRREQGRYVC